MILETVTGKLIDVENPKVEDIDIEDIAWGLSRIARFCGATITPVPYNVGQHSILVAEKVERDIENMGWPKGLNYDTVLKALLHDAAEVYVGDVPSPVKKIPSLQPVFKELEDRLMSAIFDAFNLAPMSSEEYKIIKTADKWAQKIEAHAFMPSRGKHWEGMPQVSLEELQSFDQPDTAINTYKAFIAKFNELLGMR